MNQMDTTKEPGPNFWLTLPAGTGTGDVSTVTTIGDSLVAPLGLFPVPTVGKYGRDFVTAFMPVIVRTTAHLSPDSTCLTGSSVHYPPRSVLTALVKAGVKGDWSIDVFWVVSDASVVLSMFADGSDEALQLNLVHHAWRFANVKPRDQCTDAGVLMGIFSCDHTIVPALKQSIGFNALTPQRVRIHPAGGKRSSAMACSPNNARFMLNSGGSGASGGLSMFWSAAVCPGARRACVSLNWVLTSSFPRWESGLSSVSTIPDLLTHCGTNLKASRDDEDVPESVTAAITEVRRMFGLEERPEAPESFPVAVDSVEHKGSEDDSKSSSCDAVSSTTVTVTEHGGSTMKPPSTLGSGITITFASSVKCSMCRQVLNSSGYSRNQLSKGPSRKCKACCAGLSGAAKK